MTVPQLPLHTQLLQMISGYWLSQGIYAVAKLGIADLLQEGSHSCTELASATQTNTSALYRLMRALASVGIFSETKPHSFSLTPLGKHLCSDHPKSQRNNAIMLGEPNHYQTWGDLLYCIQTGESAFNHRWGMGVFDYYKSHPDEAEIFEKSMNNFSATEVAAIAPAYDFAEFTTVVDVGGGYGEMLAQLLQQYPHHQGILFDEEYVIAHCQPTLNKYGVEHRCQTISGNFFASVPPGGDAYLLKHILHDWDDERAIIILRNCCRFMPEHGKVLVMELVVPPGDTPSASKMLDLNMLVMCPGGKERTEAEFAELFTQAGLKLTQIVRTEEDICVIEGCKI